MTDRTRTRTLAVIGLAVVLMATALILWRPFGSSSPSQSNQHQTAITPAELDQTPLQPVNRPTPTPTIPPERVVHFPEDRSIGKLYVRNWISDWRERNEWKFLGEAEGTVTVPLGKELRLMFIGQLDQGLSSLAEIGKHDLQSLALAGGGTTLVFPAPDGTATSVVSDLTITGGDLWFIREYRSLRELILIGVKIGDHGFTRLKGLTSLKKLTLAKADIGNTGLEQIGNLTSLSELQISETNVTDKGLAELKALPSLRWLYLSSNPQISDAGLRHLRSLTGLEQLILNDISITDKGFPYLQSIRSLKVLSLYGTQISADGLASLKQGLPDCRIILRSFAVTPSPTPILPTRPPVS